MAWTCVRCDKKIFTPRPDNEFSFAVKWRYDRNAKELFADLKNLKELKETSVVTHLLCRHPSVDGFGERMKKALKMPKTSSHPLLF